MEQITILQLVGHGLGVATPKMIISNKEVDTEAQWNGWISSSTSLGWNTGAL
jgi:hypothetical protein